MQSVRMASPILGLIQNHGFHALMAVISDFAAVQRSASVDDRNLIAGTMPQHFNAMS